MVTTGVVFLDVTATVAQAGVSEVEADEVLLEVEEADEELVVMLEVVEADEKLVGVSEEEADEELVVLEGRVDETGWELVEVVASQYTSTAKPEQLIYACAQ